jgi:hypothetical protein
MYTKLNLEVRHNKTDELLSELGKRKFKGKSAISVCYQVGSLLGVTGQTVYNYYLGEGRKDGFLKEAIIEVFKTLP